MKEAIKNRLKITDKFWGSYIKVVREQVIPYQWDALNDRLPNVAPSHAIENFRIAAGEAEGEFYGMVFQDSDVAKWLEAVAYSLEHKPDSELEKKADEVIDLMEKAQAEDGYLNTYYQVKEPGKRWTNLRDNHELYCAGHLIEAAVAYYQSTGKRKFLDIMIKYADHIERVFGREEGQIHGYPGHQEIELALVKLYEVTEDEKYLKLSQYFIDERGTQPHFFDIEKKKRNDSKPFWFNDDYAYHQAHKPVREQEKAVGHAVRATYMYSAMADLTAKTGDHELREATKKLWKNVTQKQMYITGGIGSMVFGEAFSFDYDLPNDLAYTETCATVALAFWAKRMLSLEINSQYADVLETALYNGSISGMDLDGKKFFYVNPLEVSPQACHVRKDHQHVKTVRQPWFGCACCPPNIARLIASVGHYVYTQEEDELFIHLYMGNEASFTIQNREVQMIQRTNYPWDGDVSIEVLPEGEHRFTLALRIPGWANGATVKVNGEYVDHVPLMKDGYVYIERTWAPNDLIELSFPMEVERIQANPQVRHNNGKVALRRGPIVYCLEEADNGPNLAGIILPRDSELKAEYNEEILGGVVLIKGEALREDEESWNNTLYRPVEDHPKSVQITAIPYYAWCNREPGEMLVWMNE
ncbi:glycoside hydrolase family 127 protein [Lederbergia sp. NSJ-179]|uniref:glycoside hydrolase family 127 protein n=1 Tax=Lederbergia sp. NSJ-179 TaxID=2931402 RepID=UPI001FD47C1C|nr:beta-L-arabinofuranosidase domain-containing protein [Lederbergia sp. NSJ-179]MCJ7843616.1 glycoside hydrolase family 127 protein [Lederbergia sp. NSJ-179]